MLRIIFSTTDKVFEHLKKFGITKVIVDETIGDGFDRSIRHYNIVPDDQTISKLGAIPEGITIDYIYEEPKNTRYIVMYDFFGNKK